jgi:CBS domain-containing protein
MVTEMSGKGEVEVLEGDEGEPEIERHRNVGRHLLESRISELKMAKPVTIPANGTVARAVDLMKREKVGALVVVDKGKRATRVVGIFTERDLVSRCIGKPGFGRLRVSKVMTPNPEVLEPKDSLAFALNKMSVGRFRHVPVVDGKGKPIGMLSIRDIVDFVVEIIPEEILNLPPDPKYAMPRQVDGA